MTTVKDLSVNEPVNRLRGGLPKIGIRPTIDGRLGSVRESLEARTTFNTDCGIEDYFEEVTLNNWRNQELPQDETVVEFLEMDAFTYVSVSFIPILTFEYRILFENEKTLIEIDDFGCTVKRDKKAPNMFCGLYTDFG